MHSRWHNENQILLLPVFCKNVLLALIDQSVSTQKYLSPFSTVILKSKAAEFNSISTVQVC